MVLKETYKLANGIEIPKIGLGTWLIDNEVVEKPVKEAIKHGYRHIDTAQAYQNEEGVGKGVTASGVARDDIFITSKVAAGLKTYKEAAISIDESLKKLDLDFLDLMIIHSPKPWDEFHGDNHYKKGNLEAWRALEDAYEAGKIKSIGLSNFEIEDVDNILQNCKVKPMVNQILAHLRNTPFELIEYCQNKDILIEAYSPLGHGELLDDDDLKEMADKYEVSVPQLCVRYTLQLGAVTLPKSSNPEHIKSNTEVDFEISQEDMEKLKNLETIKDYGESKKFPVFAD